MSPFCIHCGQQHPAESRFCPVTGKTIPEPAAASAPPPPPADAAPPPVGAPTPAPPTAAPQAAAPSAAPPQPAAPPPPGAPFAAAAAAAEDPMGGKPIGDLLVEAFNMYKANWKPLLLTCAVLFAPAALVKSCAVSMVMAPTVAVANRFGADVQAAANDAAEAAKALEQEVSRAAKAGQADPAATRAAARAHREAAERFGRQMGGSGAALLGGLGAMFLGLIATFITAFIVYGLVLPLTRAAVTVAAADIILGGEAGWFEVWGLLLRRLGPLLSAVLPASILIAVGFVFLVIPGLVLGLLFVFVSQVALIEGVGGMAALRRSVDLVKFDWLKVLLVMIIFAIVTGVAGWVARLIVPTGSLFLGGLIGDAITLVLLPFPTLGAVLLYFDIRRRRDGFDDDKLRAELAALRAA